MTWLWLQQNNSTQEDWTLVEPHTDVIITKTRRKTRKESKLVQSIAKKFELGDLAENSEPRGNTFSEVFHDTLFKHACAALAGCSARAAARKGRQHTALHLPGAQTITVAPLDI